MNDSATNAGGWLVTTMRTFVNNDIYNSLPIDLKNAIIDTIVVSSYGGGGTENFTSTDKLYLLAPKEIYTNWSSSYDTAKNLTRTLDYYKNIGVTESNNDGAKKKNGTSFSSWWLRSASSNTSYSFYSVVSNGFYDNNRADTTNGVSPAFRLG